MPEVLWKIFVRIMEKKGLKVEMKNSLKSFYDSKRSSPRTNPHDTTTALALYFRVIIIAFKVTDDNKVFRFRTKVKKLCCQKFIFCKKFWFIGGKSHF